MKDENDEYSRAGNELKTFMDRMEKLHQEYEPTWEDEARQFGFRFAFFFLFGCSGILLIALENEWLPASAGNGNGSFFWLLGFSVLSGFLARKLYLVVRMKTLDTLTGGKGREVSENMRTKEFTKMVDGVWAKRKDS